MLMHRRCFYYFYINLSLRFHIYCPECLEKADLFSLPPYRQSAIGSVTGSHAWTKSGEQAKAHAVSDMKAASEARDASSQGYGKAEELAGKAVGCEGMVKEGGVSKEE